MDRGVLQREVAVQLEVSPETVTNWELGQTEPEIRYWPAILRFLGDDPLPEPMTLPEHLKAVRRCLGLSQRHLAGLLGVDPSTVREWETGTRRPCPILRRELESTLWGLASR